MARLKQLTLMHLWCHYISISAVLLLVVTAGAESLEDERLQQAGLPNPACSSGNGHCLAALFPEPTLLSPDYFTGSKPLDYMWSRLDAGTAWIVARPYASGRDTYAELSEMLAAEPYWRQRVRLNAYVQVKGTDGGAFGALFVRVADGEGKVLAFDNMRRRRIASLHATYGWHTVVLDVPGPPPLEDGDVCPAEGSLPVLIQGGILLSGGKGFIGVSQLSFEVVSNDVQVTGGPAPWSGPGA